MVFLEKNLLIKLKLYKNNLGHGLDCFFMPKILLKRHFSSILSHILTICAIIYPQRGDFVEENIKKEIEYYSRIYSPECKKVLELKEKLKNFKKQ